MPAAKTRITGPLQIEGLTDAPPVKKDSGIDLSQFRDTLTASWNKKQAGNPTPGFAMTVPTAQVNALQSRFRSAARELNLGVAFDTGEDDNGKTRVVVEARKKKVMPARTTAVSNGGGNTPAGLPTPPAAGRKAGK